MLALAYHNDDQPGFFVEFGAADGVRFSNTYMLEKDRGWTGILAEPVREFHKSLATNRSCTVSHRAVWANSTDTLSIDVRENMQLSSIAGAAYVPVDATRSRVVRRYQVDCVSLRDLLAEHNAPAIIDYMSIDVEGAELAVLANFDLSIYQIRVLSIEHNYAPDRREVQQILAKHGYRRVLGLLSRWDDWCVHQSTGR